MAWATRHGTARVIGPAAPTTVNWNDKYNQIYSRRIWARHKTNVRSYFDSSITNRIVSIGGRFRPLYPLASILSNLTIWMFYYQKTEKREKNWQLGIIYNKCKVYKTDSLAQAGPEHTMVRLFEPLQYRPLDDGSGLLQFLCSVLWPVPHVTVQPE